MVVEQFLDVPRSANYWTWYDWPQYDGPQHDGLQYDKPQYDGLWYDWQHLDWPKHDGQCQDGHWWKFEAGGGDNTLLSPNLNKIIVHKQRVNKRILRKLANCLGNPQRKGWIVESCLEPCLINIAMLLMFHLPPRSVE